MFKKLKSNQAINSVHHPSSSVQDQMKTLQQLQALNQKNAKTLDGLPDMNSKNMDMLRKNAEMLRR